MSLLSASPFPYQLAKQTCPPTDLWPNFKPSTPSPKDTSKPEEPKQDAHQTALDRAFIAAREALQGNSLRQRQSERTSTQPLLHAQTDHVRIRVSKAVKLTY